MSTKEQAAKRYRHAKNANLCQHCRCRPKIEGLSRCDVCRNKQKERYAKKKHDPLFIADNRARATAWQKAHPGRRNIITRQYRAKKRKQVFDYYGNQCACCGENEEQFLTIDHVNNNGKQHRIRIGSGGAAIHGWLVRNHFPDGFQLLCFNCNCAKGFFGECPHQRK